MTGDLVTIEIEITLWSLLSSYAFFSDLPFFILIFLTQTGLKQISINKNLNRERQNRLQCLINIERKKVA